MLSVTASEFAKKFCQYRDASQREPVAVTTHSRVTGVLISAQAYEEYMRFKRMATRSLRVEDLSDEALNAIETARMDPQHDHLNALLDED